MGGACQRVAQQLQGPQNRLIGPCLLCLLHGDPEVVYNLLTLKRHLADPVEMNAYLLSILPASSVSHVVNEPLSAILTKKRQRSHRQIQKRKPILHILQPDEAVQIFSVITA